MKWCYQHMKMLQSHVWNRPWRTSSEFMGEFGTKPKPGPSNYFLTISWVSTTCRCTLICCHKFLLFICYTRNYEQPIARTLCTYTEQSDGNIHNLFIYLCSYCAYWLINVYYIPTYAQISTVSLYWITPTCFAVNTPSSGSLQLC